MGAHLFECSGNANPSNFGLMSVAEWQGIPLTDVETIHKAQPNVEIFIYQADHGFNCDERGSYDAASAALAKQRTLAFFGKHL